METGGEGKEEMRGWEGCWMKIKGVNVTNWKYERKREG